MPEAEHVDTTGSCESQCTTGLDDSVCASADADSGAELAESSTGSQDKLAASGTQLASATNLTKSRKQEDGLDPGQEEEEERINPLGLYLVQKTGRGRGVFAPRAIPAGTHIEDSPVLVLTKQQWDEGKLNDTILGEYGFCWTAGGMALGLGLASLFNHSPAPNVNFIRQPKTSTIRFMTSRRVEAGEELCICYTADESKLWFVPSAKPFDAQAGQQDGPPTASSSILPEGHAGPAPAAPDEFEVSESSAFPSFAASESDEFFGSSSTEGDRAEARRRRIENKAGSQDQRKDKQARRERYLAKHKSKSSTTPAAAPSELELHQPQPVSLTSSSTSRLLPGAGTSRSVTPPPDLTFPEYPALPEDFAADLPPPLHSDVPTRRDKSDGDAEIVPDLDWREEDWLEEKKNKAGPSRSTEIEGWSDLVKVKGPAEREEEEEEKAKLEVWIVDVADPRMTRQLLEFSKEKCSADPRMRHLKRVAKRTHNGEPNRTLIVLTCTDDRNLESICREMTEFDASLSVFEPFPYLVPATPARTPAGLKTRSAIWPTSYTPFPPQQVSSAVWSPARKAWIMAGVKRIIADALVAKQRGELPVSVFCAAPPESLWPQTDSFIPPTTGLRAAACDTRISAAHPLRHAAFNCIAGVATLRTQPPYSEMTPTRNGADYLLTSLSLFITHEPCVMCCMALLHSRVREVFYLYPRKRGGGLESAFGVHGRKDLNHRYEVWKYDGPLARQAEDALRIDDNMAL